MKEHRAKETPFPPIDLMGAKKTGLRTQFAALCYRLRKGKPEVLLVTSRRSKRWIIPKGWPQNGMLPAQSAAIEALEEAGVDIPSDIKNIDEVQANIWYCNGCITS